MSCKEMIRHINNTKSNIITKRIMNIIVKLTIKYRLRKYLSVLVIKLMSNELQ
jgi:hypothetical protein